MKMRAIYQEKQKRWQMFRDAEQQRRVDRANEQEMNRLNTIIAESRARRKYTNSKFHHSLTVRSYHQAALTIQRAYRRMKLRRAVEAKLDQQLGVIRNKIRERAAQVIQTAWKTYQQHVLYKALYFTSIMTGPVVAISRRTQSPPGVHSYERGISITGIRS